MGNYSLQLRDLASGEELCHDPPSFGMLYWVSIGISVKRWQLFA